MYKKKILAIVVLYNPNRLLLREVIKNIITQVDFIWIGDNSPRKTEIEENEKIHYEFLNKNTGIATAQNLGLEYAITNDYDYIFYLDQDSICPSGLIDKLYLNYTSLIENNVKVGAVGPRAINRQNNKEYKGLIKKGVKRSEDLTEVSELISSASFINIETIKIVGLMDEELFIDGVDHEWCWRAKRENFRFFICENVKLSHQLGEGDRTFLFIDVAISTPFRMYYQYRNYFKLVRRNYVPSYWKWSNGLKYLVKLFYYPIFLDKRRDYLRNIFLGIKDGIKN